MAKDFPVLKPSSDSQTNCIHSHFIICICYCVKVVPEPKKLFLVVSEPLMSADSYYVSPQPLFCQAEKTRLLQSFLPKHNPDYHVLRLLGLEATLYARMPEQQIASQGRQRHWHWRSLLMVPCLMPVRFAKAFLWWFHTGSSRLVHQACSPR